MNSSDVQIEIFRVIKNSIPRHLSLVDEIASVLVLSNDSAYRRIRGEKPLSLEEIYKLCNHFHLSLDELLGLHSDSFIFRGNLVHTSDFDFDQWLKKLAQNVKYFTSFKAKKIYFLCKDIPVFYHFHYKEVAAFKHYVWMKGLFNAPELNNKKFKLSDYPEDLFDLGVNALRIYNKIDCVEIWNVESINSTIRQIDFYHESGMFENEEEVLIIYESLNKLINHLNKQADLGHKFLEEEENYTQNGTYQMYFNEIVLGDNSAVAIFDGSKLGYITHSVINMMSTNDVLFCDYLFDSILNLMKRSTLISSVSERERLRFFKHLRMRINTRSQHLKPNI